MFENPVTEPKRCQNPKNRFLSCFPEWLRYFLNRSKRGESRREGCLPRKTFVAADTGYWILKILWILVLGIWMF
jgi:hypothetical protein